MFTNRVGSDLTHNIQSDLELLASDEYFSLTSESVNDQEKSFKALSVTSPSPSSVTLT